MKRLICTLALCFFIAGLRAQDEFVVNTALDSTQRDPHIAADSSGAFVVAWMSVNRTSTDSKGDICYRRFDASGIPLDAEQIANGTTAGDQRKPSIAAAGNGDFLIAWASAENLDSAYDVKARLFKNGTPVGPEFRVNSYTPHSQTNPAVAASPLGGYVVAWESWFEDGSDRGVYARRIDANGNLVGNEIPVNVTTAYSQARPAVRFFDDGRFIVVWESWKQDVPASPGYGLSGRIFNADGTPSTGEFAVNTYTQNYQWFADVETFADNSFAVVWCSWGQDGDGGAIVLQRFTTSGEKSGPEIVANKTTLNYQWLSKIRRMSDGGFVVMWSSWKEDGDREGVFAQRFDGEARPSSFETGVNTTTASFQWEPDFIVRPDNSALGVWSSWGQTGHDYDIVGRAIAFERSEGRFSPGGYRHVAGSSTTGLVVHVVDSTLVTTATYAITFDTLTSHSAAVTVRNKATGDTVVNRYDVDRGEGVFYLTPVFNGMAIEIIPEFHFGLNASASYFANHSGTNVLTGVKLPSTGTVRVAPLDAALIWGSTDTLSDGSYATPSDSAYGSDLLRNVAIPFYGWDETNGKRIDMLIIETKKNKRWDPGEKILFRTPPPYRITNFDTHAEVFLTLPGGAYALPHTGDTTYVLTMRPIQQGEEYEFDASKEGIAGVREALHYPLQFALHQNYPNPFNPSTTIRFSVPAGTIGPIVLRVYDLLGRQVGELVNGPLRGGEYRVVFDGRNRASGVYFYRLETGARSIVRKMLLVK